MNRPSDQSPSPYVAQSTQPSTRQPTVNSMVNSTAQSSDQSHATPIRQPDPMLAKPIVKWAGGKSKLVAELLQHVPEPFLNASCPRAPGILSRSQAGRRSSFISVTHQPCLGT